MSSPMLDLDQLQSEMQALLSPLDGVSICCCGLLDPNLHPDQHLSDCELGLLDDTSSFSSSCSDARETLSNNRVDEAIDRRRKHREAMARLRRGWRTSIAALQHQEKHLHAVLRRMVAVSSYQREDAQVIPSDSLESLRQSYRDLVAEQLRLEDELHNLEATRAHREKYERLLQRELVRVRLFHACKEET